MQKSISALYNLPVPLELIERRIYLIRGQKVMFDFDLAELYRIETGHLNRAIRRNARRFPDDFMFQLTKKEFENLRCQFGISSSGYGGRRYLPYVFTEHGVAMLSSVLNSERAVQMNILIIRAFIKLRQLLASHKELAHKVEQLERTQTEQGTVLALVVKDIENLDKKLVKEIRKLKNPRRRKLKIGFAT